MRNFKHFTQHKRDRLEAMAAQGILQEDIARVLKVDPATVCRELKRSKQSGEYDADVATHKASILRSNSKYQGMKIEKCPALKKYIVAALQKRRSPDEIAGRMKREKILPRIGTNAIYKWMYSNYGEQYCKYLCTQRVKKRKQKRKARRSLIPNPVSIWKRPKAGEHFEGDTFVSPKKSGSKKAVAVATHQISKYLVGEKIPNHKPENMVRAVQKMNESVCMDTLTLDRGIENTGHEKFGVATYLCDPHSPWQKPHIENIIGLLRKWSIPKGTDLSLVSEEFLQHEINFLNKKYRKSLQYESAEEVARRYGILKK